MKYPNFSLSLGKSLKFKVNRPLGPNFEAEKTEVRQTDKKLNFGTFFSENSLKSEEWKKIELIRDSTAV